MTELLRNGIWLAVCDGQKALLLENRGELALPKLETRQIFEQDNPLSHEQGSSRPGRVFSSSGRRSATQESDLHQQRAAAFLAKFAAVINEEVAAGRIAKLALIAPPKAMGQLRPQLSDRVAKILVAELTRDYVRMPLYEIERALTEA